MLLLRFYHPGHDCLQSDFLILVCATIQEVGYSRSRTSPIICRIKFVNQKMVMLRLRENLEKESWSCSCNLQRIGHLLLLIISDKPTLQMMFMTHRNWQIDFALRFWFYFFQCGDFDSRSFLSSESIFANLHTLNRNYD